MADQYVNDHQYADLSTVTRKDTVREQNRQNELQASYEEPYEIKRRASPLPDIPQGGRTEGGSSHGGGSPKENNSRRVHFGGTPTPLVNVISDKPSVSKDRSPKLPIKPGPTGSTGSNSSPKSNSGKNNPKTDPTTRPPMALPKPGGRGSPSGKSSPIGRSSPSAKTGTSGKSSPTQSPDGQPTYNQSAHSYLELLPDPSPQEVAAAKRQQTPPKQTDAQRKETNPTLTDAKASGGVMEKVKALDSKFKLSTSPTIGRKKAEGNYTSIADGDVYTQ